MVISVKSDSSPRILFAEDNEDHAYLIRRCLEPIGVDLTHAWDGEGVLRTLEGWLDGGPDLILLDINLPRLGGLEVLEKLRANRSWASTPVVIFSTSRLQADRERAYRAGANSYVAKPASFSEFRDVLVSLGTYWTQLNVALSDHPN
jgi:two-component system, response regulator